VGVQQDNNEKKEKQKKNRKKARGRKTTKRCGCIMDGMFTMMMEWPMTM
jgi:hypothetical protein